MNHIDYYYCEVNEIPPEESEKLSEHIHQKYSKFEIENKHTKFDPNKIVYELESTDEILNKRKSSAKIVNGNNKENEL